MIGLSLGGIVGIRVVQQILDTEEDLPDCDTRLPILFLIENTETYSSAGIYIGVEEDRCEAACIVKSEQNSNSNSNPMQLSLS